MADIIKKEKTKVEEQKQEGIQIDPGNVSTLNIQLLAAINKQLTIIIDLLKENKEK